MHLDHVSRFICPKTVLVYKSIAWKTPAVSCMSLMCRFVLYFFAAIQRWHFHFIICVFLCACVYVVCLTVDAEWVFKRTVKGVNSSCVLFTHFCLNPFSQIGQCTKGGRNRGMVKLHFILLLTVSHKSGVYFKDFKDLTRNSSVTLTHTPASLRRGIKLYGWWQSSPYPAWFFSNSI